MLRTRAEMMESIKSYKPTVSNVSQVRVLLIGPVGAGNSSFFNSVNSVFRGHVTSQAITGCSATSLTAQFRTYSVKAGRGGKPLPIILCDTMGLEESTGYRKSPGLEDKITCAAYVLDACKVSILPTKLETKLQAIRRKVNLMGIPQLVLMTKVDEACPFVSQDITNVYKSGYIKEIMQQVGARLGMRLSCVVPVRNYSMEFELDPNYDILLLSAIIQMFRFADNYLDDISDRFRHMGNEDA